MVRFENLRHLQLRDCAYVRGKCLLDMKINQLSHVDLEGSEFDLKVFLHFIGFKYQNLEALILNGMKLAKPEYEEMLSNLKVNSLKAFGLNNGFGMKD